MNRRQFLRHASAYSAGFLGLRSALRTGRFTAATEGAVGYGPLVTDPLGVLNLPAGFSYVAISPQGASMDDGLVVPGNADGMAAFPGDDGTVILVRNHEFTSTTSRGPYGASNQLLGQVPVSSFYDFGRGRPPLGGTTTIVYDPVAKVVRRHFLSLAGTMRNCAGGPTPWGSWLTCEESTQLPNAQFEQDHGYVFEVPALAKQLVEPVPLRAMGRFNREAAAVDPRTGIVYMTEDRSDSLLYRFVPNVPGVLVAGGRLQALVVQGARGVNTSNRRTDRIPIGRRLRATWITLEDVTSPADDLRVQGAAEGAAVFSRGEGMWWGDRGVFFTCTDGGSQRRGQIWRYTPNDDPMAGIGNHRTAGRLELFVEPDDITVLDRPDNVTVAPWGHLFVCEDGSGADNLLGVSADGQVYLMARHIGGSSELAGATFSPDGRTLFVNIQSPGVTYAITGPW